MNKYFFIMPLLLGSGCASVKSDCLNDKNFTRFDSALSKDITDDSTMNYYMNDPGLLIPLRKQLCRHIREYKRITYFEIFSFLYEDRSGIVYVHDSEQFFSFNQSKHNGKLKFNSGVNTQSVLYKLMIKFKEDLRWNTDSYCEDNRRLNLAVLRGE